MKPYYHKLLFDYFGKIEEKEVDDFFVFCVKYHNKFSNRNPVRRSQGKFFGIVSTL